MSLAEVFNQIVLSRPAAILGAAAGLVAVGGAAVYGSPVLAVVCAVATGKCMAHAEKLKAQTPNIR